jgi:hypothetical protein
MGYVQLVSDPTMVVQIMNILESADLLLSFDSYCVVYVTKAARWFKDTVNTTTATSRLAQKLSYARKLSLSQRAQDCSSAIELVECRAPRVGNVLHGNIRRYDYALQIHPHTPQPGP